MGKRKSSSNRADGRVNVCFSYDGRKYVVTGKNKEEAFLKKQEKIEAIKTGKENRINPTLNHYYYNVFSPNRAGKVKESTMRSQACQFKDAASVEIEGTGGTLGELRIADVTAADIQAVQRALIEAGRVTTTVNDIIAHISHVFSQACRDRTITWNPCTAVDRLQRTEPKCKDTRHRALTEKETKIFFTAMQGSYYENLCKLMIQTGVRIGEACALNVQDFDCKENVLHITKTVARRKDGTYYISPTPKTNSGFRDIPLTDTVKRIFRDQMRIDEMLFGSVALGVPVFRSVEGRLMREYYINREIKRKCRETGIKDFTSHAFRATFATRFIEQAPTDYKILSEVLGHADVSITLNLYAAHKSKDKQAEAMDKIRIAI